MKICIVSDLHVDINKTTNFGFLNNLNVDLNIICGDVASNFIRETSLLDKIQVPTICIAGNHLGYSYEQDQLLYNALGITEMNIWDDTHQYIIKDLKEHYKQHKYITYLHNDYIEMDNYIIYGGPMYTDFQLYGEDKNTIQNCMDISQNKLNDFKEVYTYIKSKKQCRNITPKDYIKWHKQFRIGLDNCMEQTKNTNKDIIVVSHFAPNIKSISPKYLTNFVEDNYEHKIESNTCFACNILDSYKNNNRIKYWFHGHIHTPCDYMVNQCRVICNPYGYYWENKNNSNTYFGHVVKV